jgi:hypothetical protein
MWIQHKITKIISTVQVVQLALANQEQLFQLQQRVSRSQLKASRCVLE